MRIFVISDTHGQIEKVCQVYRKLKDIDLIVHCGDYYQDAISIQETLGARTLWVKGNCDGSFDGKDTAIIEAECGDILVTHGHMQNVGYSQQNIYYLAAENNCVGVLYGHTHIPALTEVDGITLMNPGSLSKPRDNSSGSYGILETDDFGLHGSIHYYDETTSESHKPKVKGGYLKGLLNYSDRF